MIRSLAAVLLALASPAFALEQIDGKCFDTREVVSAAPKTQSKVKRPSLVAPAASAPKVARKPKPRIQRWELYEVPCPVVETIEVTTFLAHPVIPPPVTFASPEPPAAPAIPDAPLTTVAEIARDCDCLAPVGGYVWTGGAGTGGIGGFYPERGPPTPVPVTPIPEPATWLLLLPALAILARRLKT